MKQELLELVKDMSDHIIHPRYEDQNENAFERNFKGLVEDLKANDIVATNEEVMECIDFLFDEKERKEEEEREAEDEYQAQLEHERIETRWVQSF